MDWFDPAEQPDSIDQLPPEFKQAKELWDSSSSTNQEKAIELLSPFVGALLILSNIDGWEALFSDPEKDGFIELEASEVRVVGIDFSRGPIPICKAETEFDVPVTEDFAATDLDEWQDNNGRFTDAVSFYWNVPREDDIEDLELAILPAFPMACRGGA